jgi:eukaryotic-like serine/threonine-protein kinase
VLEVYEYDEVDGVPHIRMQYAQLGDLNKFLNVQQALLPRSMKMEFVY